MRKSRYTERQIALALKQAETAGEISPDQLTIDALPGGGGPVNPRLACWALGVALAFGPGGAGAEEKRGVAAKEVLAAQPPEIVERLADRGYLMLQDIDHGDGGTMFLALVIFDQPRETVIDLIKQGDRQKEYRKDINELEVIRDDGVVRVDQQTLKIMFTKIVYRLRYEREEVTDRITWTLDETFDNDIARLEGFWEFFPFEDGRTLGRFGTLVDVGSSVPGFIQDSLTRKSVVQTVDHTRRWVDSGGEWRP